MTRVGANAAARRAHPAAPVMPSQPWLFHDLRHTFALQLLRFLMRKAAQDGATAAGGTSLDWARGR